MSLIHVRSLRMNDLSPPYFWVKPVREGGGLKSLFIKLFLSTMLFQKCPHHFPIVITLEFFGSQQSSLLGDINARM